MDQFSGGGSGAVGVHGSEFALGPGIALLRGEAAPLHGFGVVLRDTEAVEVHGDDMQDRFDIDLLQIESALIATAGYLAADPENRRARAIMLLIAVWCWSVAASDSFLPWVHPAMSAVEAGIALLALWWVVWRTS